MDITRRLSIDEDIRVLCIYFCRGSIQEHLDCVVSAIDSISYGDLVDVMVRRRQNWNLLPTQVHAAVLLCTYLVAKCKLKTLLADRTTPSPCYVTLSLRAFSVARPTVWNLLADCTTPSTTTRPSGILSRQTHCLELACRPYHTIDLLYYTRPSGILSRRIHCLELAC